MCRPAVRSAMPSGTGVGGSSLRPIVEGSPVIAWASKSCPGRVTYGPDPPYPVLDT